VNSPLLRIRQLLPFFLFALFLALPLNCFAGPCGGNGQRACCNGDAEFSDRGVACNNGLAYSTVQGCNDPNGCSCSGGIIKSETSGGMCYLPASCGGEGQRACCFGFLESAPGTTLGACVSGLAEVPGCSGDCTCGGSTSIGEPDDNSCTSLPIANIAEPATNATPAPNETGLIGSAGSWTLLQESLPAGPECPPTGLCGYSDLHVHMFANLAHGGATLAGEA